MFFIVQTLGLFHSGLYLQGASVEFVILWAFHQAVRVVEMVLPLKQL